MTSRFEKHIVAIHGKKGKDWLANLPGIIKKYEKRWGVRIDGNYPLYYNFVAPVTCKNNSKAVIKLGVLGNSEFSSEMEALAVFKGKGAVKLLKYDHSGFAALIEKCEPGTVLKSLKNDTDETIIAAEVMKSLWKNSSGGDKFTKTKDLGKAFKRYRRKFSIKNGPIPVKIFEKGESIFTDLVKTSKNPVLLHGDIHHENILLSGRGFLAIDPKGYIGEREFEVGCFLRNPYPDFVFRQDAKEINKKRIVLFSEMLFLDKERIKLWAFAQSVLSAIWTAETEAEPTDYYLQAIKVFQD